MKLSQRAEYQSLIQRLHEDRKNSQEIATEIFSSDLRESLAELSLADNHPADIGTEVYQRARDMARRDGLISRCNAIDAALERWEKGAYGSCEHCGTEIPLERLELIPYTTVCTECSRLEERMEHHSTDQQPIENELLDSSWADVLHDSSDTTEFDGEDAFQTVASYGTSDSPQDLGTNRTTDNYESLYEDADEGVGVVERVEAIETEREPGRQNTIHYSKQHGHKATHT